MSEIKICEECGKAMFPCYDGLNDPPPNFIFYACKCGFVDYEEVKHAKRSN